MRENTMSEAVSRLDGFLYGISCLSGEIREYVSSSYFIEIRDDNLSATDLINSYYQEQYSFIFGTIEDLNGNLGELEKRIGSYLLRYNKTQDSPKVLELQKYLAFRVMDMIDDVFESFGRALESDVFELHEANLALPQETTFFCVGFGKTLLVLQFNKFSVSQ